MAITKKQQLLIRLVLLAFVLSALLTGALAYVLHRDLEGPKIGGDFTLQSVHGPVSLHDFQGKEVVLYFGYTSCPDACPYAMGHLAQALKPLTATQRAALEPIFVSVDYRKDTPKSTQAYVQYFLHQGIGLTGTKAQLQHVVKQYGSSFFIEPDKSSVLGYTIRHPSTFFLIDKDGDFAKALPTQVSITRLRQSIQKLL